MGVRNVSDEIVDGEVWVDELRLSGVKKDRGVAMRVQSSLKLAEQKNIFNQKLPKQNKPETQNTKRVSVFISCICKKT